MKSNKSAVRYAKALLELALEHNKVELIEADILQLLKVAHETHDFQVFLNSPLINIDKKIAVIKQIFLSSIKLLQIFWRWSPTMA